MTFVFPEWLSASVLVRGLIFSALLLLVGPVDQVRAQEAPEPGIVAPGTWTAYPAMRRVQAATSGAGAVWAGTDGGVFRYDVSTGELTRYTTVDGLSRADVRSLLFDDRFGAVWIGYSDGVLDRLDAESGEVTTYHDIARADRYPQRGINRFRVHDDHLFVATDFGIVVFDPDAGEVIDTYDKFDAFDRGQPTFDIVAAPLPDGAPGFWVGTRDGVAYARQDAPNLRVPSAWNVDELAPGPALVLAYFGGRMYLGKDHVPSANDEHGDLRRRSEDGTWAREFITGREIYDLLIRDDEMIATSLFLISKIEIDGATSTYPVSDIYIMMSGSWGPNGDLWLGTYPYGFAHVRNIPGTPASIEPDRFVAPDGPLSNEVLSVGIGNNNDVWVGLYPRGSIINGMGRLDGNIWTNYSTATGFDVPVSRVRDIAVDRRGMAWGTLEGGGVMRVDADGQVVVFNSENSPLTEEPGHPNYIVSLGVAEDSQGRVWVTNRNAPNPIHVWTPDGEWLSVPRPPGTPHGAWFGKLFIDRFDQKWTSLIRTTPGFQVTRTDPSDPTQAEAVAHTGTGSAATGTGLPNQNVNAIVQDLDGRIWLGTQRGLAVIFSPGSIFANPALAVPSWARTADQASYFLRDLNINAMDVDPAGRLWLASTDGVWLLNSSGNEVEAHFTPDNSPLPSSSVVDVAVDGASGTVWFATDGGLMSYRSVAIDPAPTAERLRVYPNPYRPEQDPFVRVEGLVAETRIRILTADGQVVAAFDGRGGSATWDGRDQRTGQLVPSGVYLVSAAGLNGEGTAHTKIAVIR